MIVLSIDSGIEKTGFSLFSKNNSHIDYKISGLILTPKDFKIEKRFKIIYDVLNKTVRKYSPDKIILERLFFFRNQKTVISIGQVQGVVMLLASQYNISLEFLTPLQIKQAVTGYGQADKQSVRKMLELTLKLRKKIKEDDEIDAIACGLAYCYLNR
jgi:crossover junction endodeoxyribonuclease RuvC